MNSYYNRRLDRRIPLGTPARILLVDGSHVEALCVELSVGGLTLQSRYVPGEAKQLEVVVESPGGRVTAPPLHVRLSVKRCIALEDQQFEIGGEIVEVLG